MTSSLIARSRQIHNTLDSTLEQVYIYFLGYVKYTLSRVRDSMLIIRRPTDLKSVHFICCTSEEWTDFKSVGLRMLLYYLGCSDNILRLRHVFVSLLIVPVLIPCLCDFLGPEFLPLLYCGVW
jgi:hypothetical protein